MGRYFQYISVLFLSIASYFGFSQQTDTNSITFIQGNHLYEVNQSSAVIELERKPFAIRYFCKKYNWDAKKPYSLQAVVVANPDDTLPAQVGKNTEDVPFFEAGRGMAPGRNNRYDTVAVTNTALHYLVYESEDDKRATLISKKKDLLELEWPIIAALHNEVDYQFADLPLPALYFVLLTDRNLNKVIDADELKIITVKFK